MEFDDQSEWLEADGRGGFASGTVSGIRTRRYHALLLTATTPPTGRVVLVNGFEAWVDLPSGTHALTTQRYAPDVLYPDGASRISSFHHEPWPTWELEVDGARLRQEIFVEYGTAITCIVWTLESGRGVTLHARPLMSGRDYHTTHHENGAFRFDPDVRGSCVAFREYDGLPRIDALSNGSYRHAPDWYRNFLYSAEGERGLDAIEDLASPGVFEWRLAAPGDRAVWLLKADNGDPADRPTSEDVEPMFVRIAASERRRRGAFASAIDRAADAYIVERGSGRTIVAGYPWFTDWGRDSFIALRGLCIATGRLDDARDILLEWAGAVSEGMLPNRFPDRGEAPEFNAVDASLWYVVAASEFLAAVRDGGRLSDAQRIAIESAVLRIVSGYAAGTRFGIRMDSDGLLASGAAGLQLTWMDAKVGDRVITPRIGKPVEVEALWLNALRIAGTFDRRWLQLFDRARAAFVERFWNEKDGFLSDVVDVDHIAGSRDDTFRANQIFAAGGLPVALLDAVCGRRVVDAVERRLLTPMGLRSLAPGEPGYAARYEGNAEARDAAYHQGTVWPWLLGAFVEAWVRVRGDTAAARREARQRFFRPLQEHLGEAGLGHISEIADAEAPFTPRGCPFQAWSLGEFIRLDRVVLRERVARETGAEPRRSIAFR